MVRILLLRGFTPGPTPALYRDASHAILDPDVPMPTNKRFFLGNKFAYQLLAVGAGSFVFVCWALLNKLYPVALMAFFIGAFLLYKLKRKVVDYSVEQGVEIYETAIKSFQPQVLIAYSWGGAALYRLLKKGIWKGPCIFLATAQDMIHEAAGLEKAEMYKVLSPGVRGVIVHGKQDAVVPVANSRRLEESIPDEYKDNWQAVYSEDVHVLFYTGSTENFNTWLRFVMSVDSSKNVAP